MRGLWLVIVILIQAQRFARSLFAARAHVPTWIDFVLPLDSRVRGNDIALGFFVGVVEFGLVLGFEVGAAIVGRG